MKNKDADLLEHPHSPVNAIDAGYIDIIYMERVGRVLDLRLRGCGFEPHRRLCFVLEQDTLILA